MALASPRLTLRQVMDWCPEPRGVQPKGSHAAIPELTGESAGAEGDEENRKLAKLIAAATRTMKANDDPADPEKGPRFIVQWRIFPNAANAQVQAGQCGCGCSCGCG